jgi:hypothetical protein
MLGLGLALTNFGTKGGISDVADGGLLSSTFLSTWGPYGMVMDFTDASISINDETDVLNYSSHGTVSATTGALLGPGSKLVYSAPSAKLTEQADGYLGFQAHNLYLNSAAPANQSITVISGATYAITITGSVSVTASGAATGTWTAGTNTFTAATTTLTLGSTSGSGTVHVRRTPSVSTYVKTTSAAVYDLPYVYSGGVRTKILPEPAVTNNASYGSDWTNAVWMKSSTVSTAKDATGPDNVANSASTITFSGAGGIGRSITKGSASVEAMSVYARRSGALSGSVYMNVSSATSGTSLVTGTDSDFSGAGSWVNRSDAGGNAVVTGGRLEISQGASNLERGRAELQLTGLTIGRVYRALVDVAHNVVGTSAAVVYAYTGANLTGTQLCNFTLAGSPNQTYHFVATETTIYLVFSTSGAGSTFTFAIDDVEVFAMAETDVTSQITTDWTRLGEVQAGSVQHPAFSLRSTSADEIEVALFQSETGSAVTSPIPTYAGAVLRAADNITLATSLWPYQQNLSIHIAWDGGPDVTSGRLGSLYGAANTRYWDLYRSGSVLASYSNHTNAGGGGLLSVPAPADFTGSHQYAARFEDSNYKSATDGTLGAADTDIVVNVVATTLALGAYPAGSNVGTMGITRIAIVTRSWSDAELQEVTTL